MVFNDYIVYALCIGLCVLMPSTCRIQTLTCIERTSWKENIETKWKNFLENKFNELKQRCFQFLWNRILLTTQVQAESKRVCFSYFNVTIGISDIDELVTISYSHITYYHKPSTLLCQIQTSISKIVKFRYKSKDIYTQEP